MDNQKVVRIISFILLHLILLLQCTHVYLCVCVRVRVSEWESESECQWVCVGVREWKWVRDRERECVSVCVLENKDNLVIKVNGYRMGKGLIPSRDTDFLRATKSSSGLEPNLLLKNLECMGHTQLDVFLRVCVCVCACVCVYKCKHASLNERVKNSGPSLNYSHVLMQTTVGRPQKSSHILEQNLWVQNVTKMLVTVHLLILMPPVFDRTQMLNWGVSLFKSRTLFKSVNISKFQ
jgi:hypothetical protein